MFAHTPPAAGHAATTHERRVRLMLWWASGLMSALGIGWAIFFSVHQVWAVVAFDAILLTVGLMVAWLTWKDRLSAAFLLTYGSMFIAIGVVSLIFDTPSERVPRSVHQFYLVLCVCALLFWRDRSAWLRWGATGACMLAYVVLASPQVAPFEGFNLSYQARLWINGAENVTAMVGLFALLHILVADVAEHSSLELDMRRGLHQEGEFFLLYQPQVEIAGQVMGAEALVRWQHPTLGLMPPSEFIPLAERSGLIEHLGVWVLQQACRQLAAWSQHPALERMTLAVNVSVSQFHHPQFVDLVRSVITATQAPAHRLRLELTESALAQDIDEVIAKMNQIRALGVSFALDDFGTGYSSLNYLKRLPLDELKVDQSFVRDILTDPSDAAIVQTIIRLGESLQFEVIAEGVETEGHRQFLLAHGCRRFQGYLFSRPLAPDALERFALKAEAEAIGPSGS